MRLLIPFLALAGSLQAAYIPIQGGLTPGRFESHQNAFVFQAASPLTAATHKYAWILRAPKADAIDRVRIKFGAITKGATTALKVSVQGVDATNGDPDGVIAAFRVIPNGDLVADTMVATGLLTSDGTDIGTKKTTTVSERIAIVAEFETFEALDSVVINAIVSSSRQNPDYFDYVNNFQAAWVPGNTSLPILVLEYAAAPVNPAMPSIVPWSGFGTETFNSGSAPNVFGVRFQFPVKCKIGFAYIFSDIDGDATLELYTAAGVTTVATLDKDVQAHTLSQTSPLPFTAEIEIEANTEYVLALKPRTVTNVSLIFMDVPYAAALDQYGPGKNFVMASATNPTTTASFTATLTRQPMLVPVITAIDVPAGGGGTRSYATVQ